MNEVKNEAIEKKLINTFMEQKYTDRNLDRGNFPV